MGEHFRLCVIGTPQEVGDLRHAAADDGVDVRKEEPLQVRTAEGIESAQTDRTVFLQILEELQQSLLPQQRSLLTFQQGDGLFLKHPAYQVINIFKVIIKMLAYHAAVIHNFADSNFF